MANPTTEILTWDEVPPAAKRLLKEALDAAKNAYAPYSRYWVGAAVETVGGKVFKGANMENASYGLTVCAEVGALQSASTAGSLGRIRRIAIVGGKSKTWKSKRGSLGRPATPCGRCRQLISEASDVSGFDIEVWCSDLNLGFVVKTTAKELLPLSFDAKDVRVARARSVLDAASWDLPAQKQRAPKSKRDL